MKVTPKDVEHYLSIIENRAKSMNGARWTVQGYRKLRKTHKTPDALKILVAAMFEKQQKKYTIDVWQLPRGDEFSRAKEDKKVGDYMNTKTITAHEHDSALLVLKMMQWKNIHHLPILDDNRGLSGLLTWTDVKKHLKNTETLDKSVNKIMRKKLITANEEMPMKEAQALMEAKAINCLPVVNDKKLVGIISSKDFQN